MTTPAGRKQRREQTDAELIEKSRNGDSASFRQLFRRYEHVVLRYAFAVCRDREKAHEAVQDTMVNMYRKLNQFDGRSEFGTWLYSIVTNHCLMKNRTTRLQRATIRLEELGEGRESGNDLRGREPERSPLEQAMNRELRDALDGAIVKLPLPMRLVFVLKDLEGLSLVQTANVLNISTEATKSRLRRARAALRKDLAGFSLS